MKQVVLCLNIPELCENLFSHPAASKYPGAGWIPYFCEDLRDAGISVVSPTHSKQSGSYLIVEEMNRQGFDLLAKGGLGGISICLESKLYQPFYYDNLPVIRQLFKHVVSFEGGEHISFPSYHELLDPVPWDERKNLCLIMANKFVEDNEQVTSPTWKQALKNSLQPMRYDTIDYFQERMDLYGKGWDSGWLPNKYLHLKALLDKRPPTAPMNKLDTLKNYKFSICFENGAEPGYITEKIIDCFAAGVIPIYLGAPDIEKYIPADSFIDMRGYPYLSDLERALSLWEWDRAQDAIQAGREYLKTELGQLHQHKNFGLYLAGKVKKDLNL